MRVLHWTAWCIHILSCRATGIRNIVNIPTRNHTWFQSTLLRSCLVKQYVFLCWIKHQWPHVVNVWWHATINMFPFPCGPSGVERETESEIVHQSVWSLFLCLPCFLHNQIHSYVLNSHNVTNWATICPFHKVLSVSFLFPLICHLSQAAATIVCHSLGARVQKIRGQLATSYSSPLPSWFVQGVAFFVVRS